MMSSLVVKGRMPRVRRTTQMETRLGFGESVVWRLVSVCGEKFYHLEKSREYEKQRTDAT